MDILHLVLRYAHLIGFAALTIGVLIQLRTTQKVVNKLMYYGAFVQLITGFALVGALSSLGKEVDGTKIMAKLGIVLLIVILAIIYRKKDLTQTMYSIFFTLILAASITAVFL